MKTRVGELIEDTFNVCTLAFNGKNGLDHAEEILKGCRQNDCDPVGLQGTRRDDQIGFTAAGYAVYCRGSGGGLTQANGQYGVRFAIKKSILQDKEKGGLAAKHVSARLMKVSS